MSDPIIYADIISQPARAVLSYCEVLGLKYTLREIRLFRGEHLTEDYKKISATQTIPTMVHENLSLYESHAIMSYLSSLSPIGKNWYPEDRVERALVDCYLHWHHFHIRFGCGVYLFNQFVAPILYGKGSDEVSKMTTDAREDAFAMIEGILGQGLYVARTKNPTIADISCYAEVVSLIQINFDFSKYPNIKAWMSKIGEIDGVKKIHQRFFKITFKPKL